MWHEDVLDAILLIPPIAARNLLDASQGGSSLIPERNDPFRFYEFNLFGQNIPIDLVGADWRPMNRSSLLLNTIMVFPSLNTSDTNSVAFLHLEISF